MPKSSMRRFKLDEQHLLAHVTLRLSFEGVASPLFDLHLVECVFEEDHGVFVLNLVQEEVGQLLQLVDRPVVNFLFVLD
jgi:hypothetical protein